MLLTKREAGGLNYEVGFNKPLLCLAEIVPDVKDQLVWHVAAALRHLIAGHTETANVSVDNYLEKAASEVIANTNPDVHSASAAVAQALYLGGYLGSVALSAIFRNGDFRLFEAAISQLTSIDIRFVRRLIFETGGARPDRPNKRSWPFYRRRTLYTQRDYSFVAMHFSGICRRNDFVSGSTFKGFC